MKWSKVVWNGPGKEGKGYISTQSHVLDKTPYSYNTRFTEEIGTNPEELLGAAHAACFSMKFSFVLGEAGFVPDRIETTAEVTLDKDTITESHLIVVAIIPGISKEKFEELATNAKDNCPVSKALRMKVTMECAVSGEGVIV